LVSRPAGCASGACCCRAPPRSSVTSPQCATRPSGWHTIATALDDEQRERLRRLLTVLYGTSVSALERLRRAPVSVSAQGLLGALTRLREIRAVGVGEVDAGAWPDSRVAALARYGSTAKA